MSTTSTVHKPCGRWSWFVTTACVGLSVFAMVGALVLLAGPATASSPLTTVSLPSVTVPSVTVPSVTTPTVTAGPITTPQVTTRQMKTPSVNTHGEHAFFSGPAPAYLYATGRAGVELADKRRVDPAFILVPRTPRETRPSSPAPSAPAAPGSLRRARDHSS